MRFFSYKFVFWSKSSLKQAKFPVRSDLGYFCLSHSKLILFSINVLKIVRSSIKLPKLTATLRLWAGARVIVRVLFITSQLFHQNCVEYSISLAFTTGQGYSKIHIHPIYSPVMVSFSVRETGKEYWSLCDNVSSIFQFCLFEQLI